jgi:RNA polymerase sigma factor (TIGR02999 family)
MKQSVLAPTEVDQAFATTYGELCRLANGVLTRTNSHHTLPASELVNESYLKMARSRANRYKSRGHFFAIAAKVMRQIVLDGMRRRSAAKRGNGDDAVELNDEIAGAECGTVGELELQQALRALEHLDPRKAAVVEMSGLRGMTYEEMSAELSISIPTVVRNLRAARSWLAEYLGVAECR